MIDPTALLRVDLGLFFLIGLLGGVHCIGMCGPVGFDVRQRADAA